MEKGKVVDFKVKFSNKQVFNVAKWIKKREM